MNPPRSAPEPTGTTEIRNPAAVVHALAEGFDPRTGEKLTGEGPWSDADVIRALFLAAEALERTVRNGRPRTVTNPPPAAGTPWTPEEDARLKSEFETTKDLAALAERHARTRGAISARLVRLGLFPAGGDPARPGS